jgi:hypothetical protein
VDCGIAIILKELRVMHFEFLVEDQSCGKAMEILVPKMIKNGNTYRIKSYKGLGHIPKKQKPKTDANKRIFLDQLPRLLRGYGRAQPESFIILICDLDDRNRKSFLAELLDVLNACTQKPNAYFCLAVEELEAWYLGDLDAIHAAYPGAKSNILNGYINDSICGTWELLADAVYDGGHISLSRKGWQAIGLEKTLWAKTISPRMKVENNKSPSFNYLRKTLNMLSAVG